MKEKKIRILMAKPGLDGHDIGAKAVVFALRNAGMEVIYTGRHQTPEQIVQATLQEDVDALGLSILSGNHLFLCQKLVNLMQEKGLEDVLVVVGGNIPMKDREALHKIGVAGVFPMGSTFPEIVDFISHHVASKEEEMPA